MLEEGIGLNTERGADSSHSGFQNPLKRRSKTKPVPKHWKKNESLSKNLRYSCQVMALLLGPKALREG